MHPDPGLLQRAGKACYATGGSTPPLHLPGFRTTECETRYAPQPESALAPCRMRFSVGTRQAQINKDKADRQLEAERLRDRQWPSELEKIVIPIR